MSYASARNICSLADGLSSVSLLAGRWRAWLSSSASHSPRSTSRCAATPKAATRSWLSVLTSAPDADAHQQAYRAKVLSARRCSNRGAVVLGTELGLAEPTFGRILARHHVSHICEINRITGDSARCSRRSASRYEHRTPGSQVHVDVEKLARIAAGGGLRLHGRQAAVSVAHRKRSGSDRPRQHRHDVSTRFAYSDVRPTKRLHIRRARLPRIGVFRRLRRARATGPRQNRTVQLAPVQRMDL